jgi:WD40 repeat protein
MITYLLVSRDGTVLFAGSHAGNLYVWELPTGILIKKTSCHSGEIRKIIEYKPGYLMTCTQKEVKIWSLSSFYLET